MSEADRATLHDRAIQAARSCGWVGGRSGSTRSKELFRESAWLLNQLERQLYALRSGEPTDDLQWLYDNLRLVRTDIQDLETSTKELGRLPAVRTKVEESVPRPLVLARALLVAANYQLTQENFFYFIQTVEEIEPLRLAELGAMLPALKLVLLELIAERGFKALEAFRADGLRAPSFDIGRLIRSLRFIGEIEWKETIERLSIIHRILSLDPSGVYPRMEFISREQYRRAVAGIAAHSDLNESEVAQLAVTFATNANLERSTTDAMRERLRHVGYYLIDETGSKELLSQAGYRPGIGSRFQRLFCHYPDEIYIIGIEAVTLITVVALIMSVVKNAGWFRADIRCATPDFTGYPGRGRIHELFGNSCVDAAPVAKLDFSKRIDPSCATMVAIPTLLINEKQIRSLVDDIEIRYLVNRDPNICLRVADGSSRHSRARRRPGCPYRPGNLADRGPESEICRRALRRILPVSRHRVYNPREGAWMGWERKRGKLLDLNQLLRNAFDPFPVKAGDMKRLPKIRYVLTLDSDTQLPRGSAQRMIGAMAHPLNRPSVDPELNIVTRDMAFCSRV